MASNEAARKSCFDPEATSSWRQGGPDKKAQTSSGQGCSHAEATERMRKAATTRKLRSTQQ